MRRGKEWVLKRVLTNHMLEGYKSSFCDSYKSGMNSLLEKDFEAVLAKLGDAGKDLTEEDLKWIIEQAGDVMKSKNRSAEEVESVDKLLEFIESN